MNSVDAAVASYAEKLATLDLTEHETSVRLGFYRKAFRYIRAIRYRRARHQQKTSRVHFLNRW